MVIALFALALAMIVGGLFTFVLGWDDVLLERGWTTSIAGSVAASSGVLLIGLTMIVLRLTEIRSQLERLSPEKQLSPHAPEAQTEAEQAGPATSGLFTGPAIGAATGYAAAERSEIEAAQPLFETADERRDEPLISLDDLIASEGPSETFAETRDEVLEPRVPDFLIERRETFTVSLSERTEIEEEFPVEEPESKEVEPAAFESEFGTSEYAGEPEEFGQEPVVEPASEPAEPESAPPTVIGTYNSGDNTYVMFSDGSIEAKTPQGDYRFSSLDELKAFIAGGGESGSAAT